MSKEFQIRDGNLIASFDLENENGDIDICKLLKVSHGVAKEIGMFVDYIATNKIIGDQSKEIADLEAKLAESEKALEAKESVNQMYKATLNLKDIDFSDLVRENAQLKQQLADKEQEIERLKKEIKEPEEIWNANLAELKKEVEQKLAQEFTEKINEMLKEKVEEKTIELNNQIRLMQEGQQIVYDQMQSKINGYLKVIKAKKMMKNEEAIEQLEKVKDIILNERKTTSFKFDIFNKGKDTALFWLNEYIDNQINELKEGK